MPPDLKKKFSPDLFVGGEEKPSPPKDRLRRPGPVTVVNRVFYIDVGEVPVTQIPEYMKRVKESLLSEDKDSFVEKSKAIGVWEDFFIPLKGVIPARPSLWQRIKEFFLGAPAQVLSATRIELHKVEVEL